MLMSATKHEVRRSRRAEIKISVAGSGCVGLSLAVLPA